MSLELMILMLCLLCLVSLGAQRSSGVLVQVFSDRMWRSLTLLTQIHAKAPPATSITTQPHDTKHTGKGARRGDAQSMVVYFSASAGPLSAVLTADGPLLDSAFLSCCMCCRPGGGPAVPEPGHHEPSLHGRSPFLPHAARHPLRHRTTHPRVSTHGQMPALYLGEKAPYPPLAFSHVSLTSRPFPSPFPSPVPPQPSFCNRRRRHPTIRHTPPGHCMGRMLAHPQRASLPPPLSGGGDARLLLPPPDAPALPLQGRRGTTQEVITQ